MKEKIQAGGQNNSGAPQRQSRSSPGENLLPWLRANLGREALAPLTHGDVLALRSATTLLEIHAYSPSPTYLAAFRSAVQMMQPGTRHLAFHSIAMVMDWEYRSAIWQEAGLPAIRVGRCAYEPASADSSSSTGSAS